MGLEKAYMSLLSDLPHSEEERQLFGLTLAIE